MLCRSLTCGTTLPVIFLVSDRFLFFVSSSNVLKTIGFSLYDANFYVEPFFERTGWTMMAFRN
jgi:hypothetical protein